MSDFVFHNIGVVANTPLWHGQSCPCIIPISSANAVMSSAQTPTLRERIRSVSVPLTHYVIWNADW